MEVMQTLRGLDKQVNEAAGVSVSSLEDGRFKARPSGPVRPTG
jgi:hypothetical protein